MSFVEELEANRDILDNLQEKLVSGFYLDKINIEGKFVIWGQNKEDLVLVCSTGKSEDGSDGIAVCLPLPLKFDEEWFNKYKELNLTRGGIISFYLEGFIKNDLKE